MSAPMSPRPRSLRDRRGCLMVMGATAIFDIALILWALGIIP